MTGNPDISKSCFQWKFILFCYRQDLFYKLSPFVEEQAEELMEVVPSLESINDLKLDDSKCAEQVDQKASLDDNSHVPFDKSGRECFTKYSNIPTPLLYFFALHP